MVAPESSTNSSPCVESILSASVVVAATSSGPGENKNPAMITYPNRRHCRLHSIRAHRTHPVPRRRKCEFELEAWDLPRVVSLFLPTWPTDRFRRKMGAAFLAS
jgi:hypothetical protein